MKECEAYELIEQIPGLRNTSTEVGISPANQPRRTTDTIYEKIPDGYL